jgi:hypothetical protein
MFNIGDKVKCIYKSFTQINYNHTYIVKDIYIGPGQPRIWVNDIMFGYPTKAFVLANKRKHRLPLP